MSIPLSFVLRHGCNSIRKCTPMSKFSFCCSVCAVQKYISEKAFCEIMSAGGSDSCFPVELLTIDLVCHLGSLSEWVLSKKQCFLIIRTAVRLP